MAAPPPFSTVELYTRGKAGETENRGESMVQKHAEKMQKEKEDKLLDAIQRTLPSLGKPTHVLALQEANWDLDEAVLLLRKFQLDNLERLNGIQKKRKQLRDAAEQQGAAAADVEDKDEAGGKDSAPSSSSGSESESSEDSRERARKSKKRHRSEEREPRRSSRSSKKHKKSSKSSKGKKSKKASRSSKKRSRDKDKGRDSSDSEGGNQAGGKAKLTHTDDFGKYGFLRETDIHEKRYEFTLWAREVKRIDPDGLSRFEEKDMFKEYMEDYNTGTLAHKKYYDLEAYEKYKAAKAAHKAAAKAGSGASRPKSGGPTLDDEEELRRQRAAERARQQVERLEEAYRELKHSSKAQDMREQELLRMQMALAYKTGDQKKAQQLLERLKPDDQKEEEKRKK